MGEALVQGVALLLQRLLLLPQAADGLRGLADLLFEQLAAYVDEKMREISRGSGAVDSVRIAVLAALNIADECFRNKEALGKANGAARQKANRLAKELSAALGE